MRNNLEYVMVCLTLPHSETILSLVHDNGYSPSCSIQGLGSWVTEASVFDRNVDDIDCIEGIPPVSSGYKDSGRDGDAGMLISRIFSITRGLFGEDLGPSTHMYNESILIYIKQALVCSYREFAAVLHYRSYEMHPVYLHILERCLLPTRCRPQSQG